MSQAFNELMRLALEEAYASAPTDEIVLHALEVNHRTFDEPIRVIRWPVLGEEPETFECLHEEDAPHSPGQIVNYMGAPFELLLPEKNSESLGSFAVRIDNIGDFADGYITNAALGGGKITATYREYIKGQEKDGPGAVWPGITLTKPRKEGGGMTLIFEGAVLDWIFKAFGKLILPQDYPALSPSE